MEDSLKKLLSGFIILGLVSWLALLIVVDVGSSYGKDVSTFESGYLNVHTINSTITDFTGYAQESQGQFSSYSTDKGFLEKVIDAVSLIGSNLLNIFSGIFDIILAPYNIVSGLFYAYSIPPLVTNTILGLITISIIFALYQLIRTGN